MRNVSKEMVNKSHSSSVYVYLFLPLAVQICSTWMTSCVKFKKTKGKSFRTGISEGGGKNAVSERRLRKVFKIGVLYSVVL